MGHKCPDGLADHVVRQRRVTDHSCKKQNKRNERHDQKVRSLGCICAHMIPVCPLHEPTDQLDNALFFFLLIHTIAPAVTAIGGAGPDIANIKHLLHLSTPASLSRNFFVSYHEMGFLSTVCLDIACHRKIYSYLSKVMSRKKYSRISCQL